MSSLEDVCDHLKKLIQAGDPTVTVRRQLEDITMPILLNRDIMLSERVELILFKLSQHPQFNHTNPNVEKEIAVFRDIMTLK